MASNDPANDPSDDSTNGAYQEGFDAFGREEDVTDNPHDEDSKDFREWENGWRAARQEEYGRATGEHCFRREGTDTN